MNRLFLSTIFTTAAFVTALFLQQDAFARSANIRSENPVYRMDIKHRTGEITFDGKQTKVTEDRAAEFTLKRGTAVDLWITDNNPLLFTYQDEVRDTEPTANYQALETFLEQIRNKANLDNTKSTAGTKSDVESALNPCDQVKNVLICLEKEQTKIIDMTINGRLDDAKKKVAGWTDRLSDISDYQRSCEDTDISIFNIPNRLEKLKTFIQLVHQVHSGKQLKTIDIANSRYVNEMIVKVGPNNAYPLSEEAKKKRDAIINDLGEMKIRFERKSNVRYAVSAGALYSFAQKPVIDMVKKEGKDGEEDGYVWKVSDEYKGASAAVTLNIIPEIFFADSFEPFLQLGVALSQDDIGYLLGLGFSAFVFDVGDQVDRSLTLSAGVIWQEVEKPNSGIQDGADVVIEDSGTTKEYDDGFYVMLGINF